MTLVVDVETDNTIQPFTASGGFDAVMEAMGSLQDPLNDAKDHQVVASVTFGPVGGINPPQALHGERVAARGRHNGTSEA
jgi:hypothetical protein